MDKFDEYRFIADNTQALTERRQATTQTYLTVNTALFTVLTFLVSNESLEGWALAMVNLPLFLVGVLVCFSWDQTLRQYKDQIGWRYEQLMAMEHAMPDSHQIYLKEWKNFFEPAGERERFGFSRLEVRLPRLFLVLYILYGLGLVLAIALGWTVSAPSLPEP